jgi:hypothetical protein
MKNLTSPGPLTLLTLLTLASPKDHPLGGKGLRTQAMPIGTIGSKTQLNLELVYGRADGMPNSLESMVVCGKRLSYIEHIL